MRRILRRLRGERGSMMVMAVFLGAVLTVLSVTLLDTVGNESTRAAHATVKDGAFQAAEAGYQDYMSKLLDDNSYYLHYVHPAEATRRDGAGVTAAASGACTATSKPAAATWTGNAGPWTSPNGKDRWCQLPNGYEYDLQITPPSATQNGLQIVSTGRKIGSTTDKRVIQALVRPSTIADFQMLADADISYGSSATTNGKIYAGRDASSVNHSVNHDGTATADIYAEGSITGGVVMQNGANKYTPSTSPSIRTVIANPINFNDFLTSFSDIKRAAQLAGSGLYINNTSADAIWLTFQPSGAFTVQKCTKVSGNDPAQTQPSCSSWTPTSSLCSGGSCSMPPNGAIYSEQTVIVSGTVNGRVTVASAFDIIAGGNISYQTAQGDDVLGLDATNNVYVPSWAPSTLNWRAATIAQNGDWQSYTCSADGSHNTMTFTGSTATYKGGCMSLYNTRVYNYDSELTYLQPPWFPTLNNSFTVLQYRELPTTS